MSAATATSAPPPSAWPFTTATTGTGNVAIRSHSRRIRTAIATAPSNVRIFASSFRSPPETNARSPPPRITSTSATSATASRADESSSIVAGLIAFRTAGRFTVTTATPSATEVSTSAPGPPEPPGPPGPPGPAASTAMILRSDIGILFFRK